MTSDEVEGDERSARIGRNEALFREVNERLRELNQSFADFTGTWEIVCECAEITCVERLVISPAEYEAVRQRTERFLVVPGHVDRGAERVIEQHERYAVVEKLGEAGEVAREREPRNG